VRLVGPSAPATKRGLPSSLAATRTAAAGELRAHLEIQLVGERFHVVIGLRDRGGRRRCWSRRCRRRRDNTARWMSSIASGCVRISRSLLPLRSRWKSLKRSPRKSPPRRASGPGSCVPMAPSSTRMRSDSRPGEGRSISIGRDLTLLGHCACPLTSCATAATGTRPDAINLRFDATQCASRRHLCAPFSGGSRADGRWRRRGRRGSSCRNGSRRRRDRSRSSTCSAADGCGDQLARRGIVLKALEALSQPRGTLAPVAGGEVLRLLEVLHREDAGHDRDIDAVRAHAIDDSGNRDRYRRRTG
jgi:hypothetical protein